MTTRIWDKPYVQKLIKQLRVAGYIVNKSELGAYTIKLDGETIFFAAPNGRAYLVRYDDKLLTAED